MKLQTAMLARYAETEPNGGLLNITAGGINVLGFSRVPQDLPLGLALQLTFDESEADREHTLSVFVLGPDLQQIGNRMDVPFTPRFGEFRSPGWRGVFAITGSIDLALEAFGPHSVQIELDGTTAGDVPFLVVEG